jgi:hypothetical protein
MATPHTPQSARAEYHFRDLRVLTHDNHDDTNESDPPSEWLCHPYDPTDDHDTGALLTRIAYRPAQLVRHLSSIFASTSAEERFKYWSWNFDVNGEFKLEGSLSASELNKHNDQREKTMGSSAGSRAYSREEIAWQYECEWEQLRRNRIAAEKAEMERLRTENERLKEEIGTLRQKGNV